MNRATQAKLLRIHVSESDRFGGKPLYEAIVDKCRELGIAGATALRGVEGYGEADELHGAGLLRRDQPVVISIVDTADHMARLIPEVEKMAPGVMALSDVKVIRVQQGA